MFQKNLLIYRDLLPFIKYIVGALTILLTFLFVIKPLMNIILKTMSEKKVQVSSQPEEPLKEIQEYEIPRARIEAELHQKLKEEAKQIAKQNPKQAAQLIKAWINEQ